jgi:hypothetical protein
VAYGHDLKKAARRHLHCADMLFATVPAGSQPGCKAVAGYLYGVTGELAVKEMMRDSGMRPLPSTQRRDDPFYAHFPALKALLLETAVGRRSGELRRLAEDGRLFSNWDTDMRYAPTSDIKDAWVTQWKQQAESLVAKMDAP